MLGSNDARARTLRPLVRALLLAALYGDNPQLVQQNSDYMAPLAVVGLVACLGKAARAKPLAEFGEKIVIKGTMALNRELLPPP
ncbi:hypothetical protein WCE37_03220 [Luteimonas sp. MJ250]